jgi:hypothetical protein
MKMELQEARDNAQEIAVREAGEIARWQQVVAAVDAVIPAARRYIREVLPVPRSSGQNAEDKLCAFSEVEALLLRAIAAIRFSKDIDHVDAADIDARHFAAVRRSVR